MTNATANVRFFYAAVRFLTEGLYFNVPFKNTEAFLNYGSKYHIFAGIRPLNGWHRAGGTKIRFPILGRRLFANESAFFHLFSTIVVAIKKGTLNTGWCSH